MPKAFKISRYGCFPNTTGLYILQHIPCGEPQGKERVRRRGERRGEEKERKKAVQL